jgi:hypothetical protein
MDKENKIVYLGTSHNIIKYNCESNKRFQLRILFIKNLESKKVEWKEANKLSKIWYNIKFNKCKYQSIIYKKYIHYNNLFENNT